MVISFQFDELQWFLCPSVAPKECKESQKNPKKPPTTRSYRLFKKKIQRKGRWQLYTTHSLMMGCSHKHQEKVKGSCSGTPYKASLLSSYLTVAKWWSISWLNRTFPIFLLQISLSFLQGFQSCTWFHPLFLQYGIPWGTQKKTLTKPLSTISTKSFKCLYWNISTCDRQNMNKLYSIHTTLCPPWHLLFNCIGEYQGEEEYDSFC